MNDQPFDVATLRAEMNLSRHEIVQRKAWLGLEDEDHVRLGRIGDLVEPHLGAIIDALAADLLEAGNGSYFEPDEAGKLLRDYFGGLTGGSRFDESFVDARLMMVNALQEKVSPDVSWYLAAYLFFLQEVATLVRGDAGDQAEMQAAYRTLNKLVFLDLGLAIDTHVYERNRTIRTQQRDLEELSTPVLQLRPGLLILPIIGMLDTRRAQQLTEQLLQAIRSRRGKVVVLDVTGVAAVDSRVANHLIQTVDAARLMGATAIVTGVSPDVAQTLIGLGISLGNVITVADLEGGIHEADRLLGLKVVPVDDGHNHGRVG